MPLLPSAPADAASDGEALWARALANRAARASLAHGSHEGGQCPHDAAGSKHRADGGGEAGLARQDSLPIAVKPPWKSWLRTELSRSFEVLDEKLSLNASRSLSSSHHADAAGTVGGVATGIN